MCCRFCSNVKARRRNKSAFGRRRTSTAILCWARHGIAIATGTLVITKNCHNTSVFIRLISSRLCAEASCCGPTCTERRKRHCVTQLPLGAPRQVKISQCGGCEWLFEMLGPSLVAAGDGEAVALVWPSPQQVARQIQSPANFPAIPLVSAVMQAGAKFKCTGFLEMRASKPAAAKGLFLFHVINF